MANPTFKLDGSKIAEAVRDDVSASDLMDTGNEMWKMREEANGYMKDLTVAEMKDLCGMMKEWYESD